MLRRLAILLIAMLLPVAAIAVERITVEALFSNKAMVTIDGTRRLLKLDQPSPEGVVLIDADSREAVIEVDGERQIYRLGSHVSSQFSKPETITARIQRDLSNSYSTVGSINGRNVRFLVDTGASAVAMNSGVAKRLGISYKLNGKRITVSTASGMTPAYEVELDRVQVGDIRLNRVRGFVIEGESPRRVLLGMSFLSRVKMEDQGAVLLLHSKY